MTPDDMKSLRNRLGLSQGDFAAAIGRSRDRVNRYEAGGEYIPKTVALACSAVACNLGPWPIKPDA